MNLNKIAQLCKPYKTVVLTRLPNGEGEAQFIGSFRGLYSLDGMPEVSYDNVLKVLSVPDKEHKSWGVQNKELAEEIYTAASPLRRVALPLGDRDALLALTQGAKGVFLEKRLLKPLEGLEEADAPLEFYLAGNRGYVVVTHLFKTVAVLKAVTYVSPGLIEEITSIYHVAKWMEKEQKDEE